MAMGFLSPAEKKQLRLRLELTEPNKKDDTWELAVVAITFDKEGPVPDVEVQFYHNGKRIDSTVATDGEGRAEKDFSDLKKGNHVFEAQIVGTTIKTRQKKNFKEDKPKKPEKILIHKTGSMGNYNLIFQILTGDNSPVVNATIQIMDSLNTKKVFELPKTDKLGVVQYDIQFTERRRVLTVIVLGSAIPVEKIYLYGNT